MILRLRLADVAGEMAIHMCRIRIQTAQRLMHDLHFGLQHFVFFLRVTAVVRVSLQALHFGGQLAFGVLRTSNVFDG